MAIKKTVLATDSNGVPIQGAFHPKATSVLTIGAASQKTASGFLAGSVIVQLYATAACYVNFSSSTNGDDATSSNWILPSGVMVSYSLQGATFIACLEVTGGGSLYVTTIS